MKSTSKLVFILTIFIFLFSAHGQAKGLYLAQDFTLSDIQQNTITLSSYRGKQPVILFFWTTWCPFCRRELKELNSRYLTLVKEGWEVLAIDVGEPLNKVVNFIKGYELGFKVLLDKDTTVAYDYDILGVPTYIIVDKAGNVVFVDHYFPYTEYKNLISESKK